MGDGQRWFWRWKLDQTEEFVPICSTPSLSLSFSPTSIFSSFPFYPREGGGLDQQAGVSSGGGAHVFQWREGERECVWWGLGGGLTCKFSGRKWCVIMAVLLTARQQQLCVMEQRKSGGGRVQCVHVCVRPRLCVCLCVLVNSPLSVFRRSSILSGSLELPG